MHIRIERLVALALTGCGVGPETSPEQSGELPGVEIVVQIAEDETTHLALSTGEAGGSGVGDTVEWDIAFRGWDVLTNSGVSGPGGGAAHGPLDRETYYGDTAPEIPFMDADETSGAFRGWYEYDSTDHVLWSRYHVYGIRAGDQFWKLQVLGYYGELYGAPVSSIYQLRYAEVTPEGAGETRYIEDLDATAGGLSGSSSEPSACLDLASGTPIFKNPQSARESTDWHLCFRRDTVSVNSERGGPGNTQAVDLDAGQSPESLDDLRQRTADTERSAFDSVDYGALTATGLDYRGDRVISAFSERWVDVSTSPPSVDPGAWFVRGADGESTFLVVFDSVESRIESSPSEVKLHVRQINQ